MKKNNIPDIYFIDIETSPWLSLCYGTIWEPIVVKILKYTQILSMSYRKFGDKTTYHLAQNQFKSYKPGKLNDRQLLIEISKIINKVAKNGGYVVAHNGDSFDWKIIQERVIYHRLPPLPDISTLDTKKLIKSVSRLPSNKLTHTSVFLGNGTKLKHEGMDMFVGCMDGDPKSWATNEKYNNKDVDIMHDDFTDLMPYVKLPATFSRINTDDNHMMNCSNLICLSTNLIKNGLRRAVNGWKQSYQCKDCGRYTTDTRILKDKNE